MQLKSKCRSYSFGGFKSIISCLFFKDTTITFSASLWWKHSSTLVWIRSTIKLPSHDKKLAVHSPRDRAYSLAEAICHQKERKERHSLFLGNNNSCSRSHWLQFLKVSSSRGQSLNNLNFELLNNLNFERSARWHILVVRHAEGLPIGKQWHGQHRAILLLIMWKQLKLYHNHKKRTLEIILFYIQLSKRFKWSFKSLVPNLGVLTPIRGRQSFTGGHEAFVILRGVRQFLYIPLISVKKTKLNCYFKSLDHY